MRKKRLLFLDSLRGIAILGVVLVHSTMYYNDLNPKLMQFYVEGARGVQIFLIITGATLFLSLENYENKKYFFIRKFFRIAPIYYLAIVLYLFLNGTGPRYWLGDAQYISIFNIISNLLFINGFNPYWINSLIDGGWYIAVIMPIYAMAPILFKYIKNLENAVWFIFLSLVLNHILRFRLGPLNLITDQELWNNYFLLWIPNHLPTIGLGILFYFILKNGYNENKNKSLSYKLIIISLVLIYCLIMGANIYAIDKTFIFGLAFLLLFYALSIYENKIFVNKYFIFIGNVSFNMYLIHFAVLKLADKIIWKIHFIEFLDSDKKFLIFYLITIMLTIFFAFFIHIFVEKNMYKLGERYIQYLKNRK